MEIPRLHRRLDLWLPPVVFALLTLGLFADVLFSDGQTVLGAPASDMTVQFLPWRDFGFIELRQGNLALWNPHIFGGAPFFGGFQSALLYPPNWLHLILSLGLAINCGIALHVFLAGYFTFLWCHVGRGTSVVGSMLTGVLLMFSGPYFLHLYAGHLPHLCAMVWAPIIFLALDRWLDTRRFSWCLLGMFAVAMQIFAGHPQYVYYTALAAGIYALLNVTRHERRGVALVGCASMYVGGVMLSAVQLLTGAAAASESWRAGGMRIDIAAQHSLPPENLLTLISPRIFGDIVSRPYFGRWLLWEMCLFVGVTGLVLAIYGATRAEKRARRFSGAIVYLMIILALGENTPFFVLLYKYLPGFGSFRVTAKFGFIAALMLCSLAGMGFDRLMSSASRPRRAGIVTIVGAFVVASIALIIWRAPDAGGIWERFVGYVAATHQNPVAQLTHDSPAGLRRAAIFTAQAIGWSAGTLLLIGLVLVASRRWRMITYTLPALCLVEMFLFAHSFRPTVPSQLNYPDAWAKLVAGHPGDYRVLHKSDVYANLGLSRGTDDVWGYDPGVLKRYTQFAAAMQNLAPEAGDQFVRFAQYPRIMQMLRCRYIFSDNADESVTTLPDPMPRLQLIDRCKVMSDRNQIFRALLDPTFDPRQNVILETTPNVAPQPGTDGGTVYLNRSTTDELEITADIAAPRILLITDNYASGWRATPLAGSSQSAYDVLPANYILRAIPLAAGHHHLLLRYRPITFTIGMWTSIVSSLAFAAACIRAVFLSHAGSQPVPITSSYAEPRRRTERSRFPPAPRAPDGALLPQAVGGRSHALLPDDA
jgi:hypothetical protein